MTETWIQDAIAHINDFVANGGELSGPDVPEAELSEQDDGPIFAYDQLDDGTRVLRQLIPDEELFPAPEGDDE